RVRGPVGEAPAHLPVQVVEAVARQIAEIVELERVSEVHGDPLLAPAAIHLVVGPDRRARVTHTLAALVDAAAEYAAADVPARRRPPVVVDANHRRLAITGGIVHPGQHRAEILRVEIPHQPDRAVAAAAGAILVRREQAVVHLPDTAVQLE